MTVLYLQPLPAIPMTTCWKILSYLTSCPYVSTGESFSSKMWLEMRSVVGHFMARGVRLLKFAARPLFMPQKRSRQRWVYIHQFVCLSTLVRLFLSYLSCNTISLRLSSLRRASMRRPWTSFCMSPHDGRGPDNALLEATGGAAGRSNHLDEDEERDRIERVRRIHVKRPDDRTHHHQWPASFDPSACVSDPGQSLHHACALQHPAPLALSHAHSHTLMLSASSRRLLWDESYNRVQWWSDFVFVCVSTCPLVLFVEWSTGCCDRYDYSYHCFLLMCNENKKYIVSIHLLIEVWTRLHLGEQ